MSGHALEGEHAGSEVITNLVHTFLFVEKAQKPYVSSFFRCTLIFTIDVHQN